MPQGSQPCYNSNAIEHCIKNIQNLSEHYLYGNDDCFFFDKVTPEFFFKKGKPICRFKKNLFTKSTKDRLYHKFLLNSYKLIYDKYKKVIQDSLATILMHIKKALCKNVMKHLNLKLIGQYFHI